MKSRNRCCDLNPFPALACLMLVVLSAPSRAFIGPSPELNAHDKEIALEIGTGTRDVEFSGTVGGSVIQLAELKMAQTSYDLRLSYGLSRNFTPYALIGIAKANLGLINLSAGGVSQGALNMNGEHGLMWGVGAEYQLSPSSFAPDLAIGVSGEYRTSTSDINAGEIQLDEFRMALKGSGKFDKATLYGGILYSSLNGNYAGNTTAGVRTAGPLDSKNNIGVFAGADYAFTEKINGRMELELLTAFQFNLSIAYKIGGPWLNRERTVAAPPPEPAQPMARRREPAAARAEAAPANEVRAWTPEGREVPVAEPQAPAPVRRVKPATPPPEVTTAPLPPASTREVRATRDRPSDAEERREFTEKSAEELVKIGSELTELGRYDEAISHFRRAVTADPGNFRARYNLATAQYLNRDFAAAKVSYEESIKLMPRDEESHLFLGFCYYRMGQFDGAVRAWQRVLELNPENAVALNNLQAMGR